MELAVIEKKLTKRKIIFFEDDIEYVQELSRKLDLGPDFQEVFFSDKKEIQAHIEGHHISNDEIYVVDMTIGNNDKNGLNRLKYLKEKNPRCLKIVHTSNQYIEEEAIEAGAHFYFPKDIENPENDIQKIKKAINQFDDRGVVSSQSIETRLIILEDEFEIVQGYIDSISFGNNIKEIWIPNRQQIPYIAWNDNKKLIFWVDINLGKGKEKDGLKAIKEIKEIHPTTSIIVYTANNVEEEARKAGADFFFRKDANNYEQDLYIIKNIVIGITEDLSTTQLPKEVTSNYRSDYEIYFKKIKDLVTNLPSFKNTPLNLKITKMEGKIAAKQYFKGILTEAEVKRELKMMLAESKFEFQKYLLWLNRKVIISPKEAIEVLEPFSDILDKHIVDMYLGEINRIENREIAWVSFKNLFAEADKSRQPFQYNILKKFKVVGLGARFLYIFYENLDNDRSRRIEPLTY